MIRIAVLGSTGSIGISTLAVVDRHPGRFEVVALAANRSVELLEEQVRRHHPSHVVVADEDAFGALDEPDGRWAGGRDALLEVAALSEVDVVVNALVGFAGLEPSLRALDAGKRLALANKESLVAGGPLLVDSLQRAGGELIPIDSEHSAILQCLEGCRPEEVRRIVLTASGGPFRGWSPDRLLHVTASDALSHPTWDMGAKISVDSATLANKALEVIEAHVLYGTPYDRIDVVVHPQSIVHSFVEMIDGSVLAQLGFPTMELPILYALSYPERLTDPELQTFDPVRSSPLTFEEVDHHAFPLLSMGIGAGRVGGIAPTIFNAANEVGVEAFLRGEISFPEMARVVEEVLAGSESGSGQSLDEVTEADRSARRRARYLISRRKTTVGSNG
ncbi:MAG: 1-deoxy-D-xylulose-5-phosphate reductoisomerase [Gemmatimonadota bacterium]